MHDDPMTTIQMTNNTRTQLLLGSRNLSLRFAAICTLIVQSAACGTPANSPMVVFAGKAQPRDLEQSRARTAIAKREIADVLGHEVTFKIDTSLIESNDTVEEFTERIVRGFGRTLLELRLDDAKLIRALDYKISSTTQHSETTFHDGAISIVAPTRGIGECYCKGIGPAIRNARDRTLASRYASASPKSMSESERREYRTWLLRESTYFTRSLTEKQLFGEPGSSNLLRMIQLYEAMPGDAEVAKAIAHRTQDVTQIAKNQANEVAALPKAAPFLLAQSALGAWLTKNMDALSTDDQLDVLRTLSNNKAWRGAISLDATGYVLRVTDSWLQRGMPNKVTDESTKRSSRIVCPFSPSIEGKLEVSERNCTDAWRSIRGDSTELDGVAAFVLAKKNSALAESVLPHLFANGDSKEQIALWKKFERDEATWAAATRVVAIKNSGYDNDILGESVRVWRSNRARRGSALFVWAFQAHERAESTSKEDLQAKYLASYAEAIRQEELTQYFAAHGGDLGFFYAPYLWPHLAKGYPRFPAIEPALATFMDGSEVRIRALAKLARAMCNEGARSDLASMHQWLTSYAARRPENAAALRSILAQTGSPTCADDSESR
jgi:hypothetical protein